MLLLLSTAFAQTPPPAPEPTPQPQIIWQRETHVDFTKGLELQGELVKPLGKLIVPGRSATFPPIFALRTNFNVEMKQSVSEVK